jgi:hypothetical protein
MGANQGPADVARDRIDRQLAYPGWEVQAWSELSLAVAHGVVLREGSPD